METLEEVIEGVKSKDARLYCERYGKVWQVLIKGDGSAVQLFRAPVQINFLEKPVQELEGLTVREREMIELVIQGYTNRYISQHLCVSEGTVKKTLHNAYAKLQISSRIELISRVKTK